MRNDHRTIAFALVLIFCASVSVRGDEVDSYVNTQMRNLHIPGLSLAVVREGQIIKAQGYGRIGVYCTHL